MSLSSEGDRIVREMVAAGWFETEVAAFQTAVALALARNLDPPDRQEMGGTTTKYNVGSLDPRLRDLVLRFQGAETPRPFETANLLAEAGLRHLGRALANDVRLTEALGLADDLSEK